MPIAHRFAGGLMVPQCYPSVRRPTASTTMHRVTSRQNALVARFRAAARGESADLLLLDGTHLIAEALDAGLQIDQAVVADAGAERPELRRILARLGVMAAASLRPRLAGDGRSSR